MFSFYDPPWFYFCTLDWRQSDRLWTDRSVRLPKKLIDRVATIILVSHYIQHCVEPWACVDTMLSLSRCGEFVSRSVSPTKPGETGSWRAHTKDVVYGLATSLLVSQLSDQAVTARQFSRVDPVVVGDTCSTEPDTLYTFVRHFSKCFETSKNKNTIKNNRKCHEQGGRWENPFLWLKMGRRKQIVPKKSDNLEADQQANPAAEKNDEGKFWVDFFFTF